MQDEYEADGEESKNADQNFPYSPRVSNELDSALRSKTATLVLSVTTTDPKVEVPGCRHVRLTATGCPLSQSELSTML